jgi:glutamine synthetase
MVCRPAGLAPAGEAFLAGVLNRLPALMAWTSPSPNSFRRQVRCFVFFLQ